MKSKKIIERYATLIYLDYTNKNRVDDIHDYPDYIADENGLGFSIPFIKGLFSKGLLEGKPFAVTEAGEALLADGKEYLSFFSINSPYVSIVDFASHTGEGSFNEKMDKIFKEKLVEYRAKKNYVALESINAELVDIALEMGNEREALKHAMANIAIAISGIKDYIFISRYKKNKITRKELVLHFSDCVYVNPYMVLTVEKLKEHYTEQMVDEVYDELKLGYTLCSRDRFKELMGTIINGEYNNAYWQGQITDIFKKRMGFVVPKSKKAEQKIEKADLGQSEPEQDSTQILGKDESDSEEVTAVSDAKLDEIAENESKVEGK